MKLTVAQKDLANALHIAEAAANHNTIRILSHVLLRAEGGRLFLTTTNLEHTVSVSVEAEVAAPGATTVQARLLLSIAKALEDRITLDLEKTLKITSGASFYSLPTLPADDFPQTDRAEGNTATVDAAVLKTALSVAFAASVDGVRYQLGGVLLDCDAGRAVATDGRRLAIRPLPLEGIAGRYTLPLEPAHILMRALTEGPVEVTLSRSAASFKTPSVVVASRLVDAEFPKYQDVIPKEWKHSFALSRLDASRTLRAVSVLCNDNDPCVRLSFEKSALIIASTGASGEAIETLPLEGPDEPVSLFINPVYLREALHRLEGEHVTVRVVGPTAPLCLESGSFFYLAMPLHRCQNAPQSSGVRNRAE